MQAKNRNAIPATGLQAFLRNVFGYMGLGLLTTGIVSFLVSQSPTLMNLFFGSTVMSFIVMLSPLAFVLYLSYRIHTFSTEKAQLVFFLYAAVMGIALATIFVVYPIGNIAQAFLISAGTFAGMSIYGYTTQRDLTGMGSFMFMGLVGVILASLVNIFLKNTMMDFILSVITVIVFVGLTAYDVQKLKSIYAMNASQDLSKPAITGALSLYLDFINLFLAILRLMGGRRD